MTDMVIEGGGMEEGDPRVPRTLVGRAMRFVVMSWLDDAEGS